MQHDADTIEAKLGAFVTGQGVEGADGALALASLLDCAGHAIEVWRGYEQYRFDQPPRYRLRWLRHLEAFKNGSRQLDRSRQLRSREAYPVLQDVRFGLRSDEDSTF